MSVDTTSPRSAGKTGRKARSDDPAQLGLFDAPTVAEPRETKMSSVVGADPTPAPLGPAKTPPPPSRKSRAGRLDAPRMVTVDDMPDYPPELHQTVDRMLADLGSEYLMTYRAIKASFGISRATVARRVKDGLVPGVRMANGRVLDDGPVRRFDRTQVRWLLLAVRFAKRREWE